MDSSRSMSSSTKVSRTHPSGVWPGGFPDLSQFGLHSICLLPFLFCQNGNLLAPPWCHQAWHPFMLHTLVGSLLTWCVPFYFFCHSVSSISWQLLVLQLWRVGPPTTDFGIFLLGTQLLQLYEVDPLQFCCWNSGAVELYFPRHFEIL